MDRRSEVLKAIIKHFIQTGEPVGSNTVLVSYNFNVSPATIRSDMAQLEKQGFIMQPHTSAGRIPTDQGYRLFVEDFKEEYESAKKLALKAIQSATKELRISKIKRKIYDIVSVLAHVSNNASFATLPDSDRTFYLGLSNIIKQQEFLHDAQRASQVIEVFEHNDQFMKLLNKLEISENVKIYIGQENIIPEIHSCTLMLKRINFMGHSSTIGILAPTRCNYAFNKAVLEQIDNLS